MISVKEAINKVVNTAGRLEEEELELMNALGSVLAQDVVSPIAMPPFDQSAMDGYALCGEADSYRVVREVKAGDTEVGDTLIQGEAVRIFTGAMLPEGATAVAKQEIIDREGDVITLQEEVRLGMSIRKKGEEIPLNGLAISKGTLLNPAAIGFLSGLGVQKVGVVKKPKIAIIVTGNELTKAGEELLPGRIYESNSSTLTSVLKYAGFDSTVVTVKDDYTSTEKSIEKAINENDLTIITGGISVGDYDFVGEALGAVGVKELFYKVKQKPGKPLFYGAKDNKRVFGLPGNPAAVLSCFYMYVLPAIKTMMGIKEPLLEQRKLKITHNFSKKGDRAHLLKARITNEGVEVHTGQSSAMLSSFVEANCLMYLSEEDGEVEAGADVEVYMLPHL